MLERWRTRSRRSWDLPFILAASNAPWRAKKNSDTRTGRASVTRSAESVRGFANRGSCRARPTRGVLRGGPSRIVTGGHSAAVLPSISGCHAALPRSADPLYSVSSVSALGGQHGIAGTFGGEPCLLMLTKRSAPIICAAMHSCTCAIIPCRKICPSSFILIAISRVFLPI